MKNLSGIGTSLLERAKKESSPNETMTRSPATPSPQARSESERRSKRLMIIERLRLDMSLPPLTDKVLAATAGSWLCHLDKAKVPIERFDECYAEAIAIRAIQGAHQPFHVSELVGAWHAIRERERY